MEFTQENAYLSLIEVNLPWKPAEKVNFDLKKLSTWAFEFNEQKFSIEVNII